MESRYDCFSYLVDEQSIGEILHSLWRELPLDGQIWIILFDRTRIPIIQIGFNIIWIQSQQRIVYRFGIFIGDLLSRHWYTINDEEAGVPPVTELTPLILKVIPLDNEPSVGIICTPLILPCSACNVCVELLFTISFIFTEATAVAISLFAGYHSLQQPPHPSL